MKKVSSNDEIDAEKLTPDYPIPKTELLPVPKPINKDRINEFASLLSASVHLSHPPSTKKQIVTVPIAIVSPTCSENRNFPLAPSANSNREQHELCYTIKSSDAQHEQIKRHIDARYNEKLDDRGSIKINTANIKAIFEQKISDTNKALSQSSEHLLHLPEIKHQHRKIPVSYGSLKRNLQNNQQSVMMNNNRKKSYQGFSLMNKYTDHITGAKDVLIEDKQVKFTLYKRSFSLRSYLYSLNLIICLDQILIL